MATDSHPHMLLFHTPPFERLQALSLEERRQLVQQWNDWYDGLLAQKKLTLGKPLYPRARIIEGAKGERVVDGPFAEAKEAVAGFFILTVGWDEATEIARRCPGLAFGYRVEVRAVGETCLLSQLIEPANEPAPGIH
jgi:hypothetical protein